MITRFCGKAIFWEKFIGFIAYILNDTNIILYFFFDSWSFMTINLTHTRCAGTEFMNKLFYKIFIIIISNKPGYL